MRRTDPRITHRRPELSQHFLRDAATARAIVRRLAFSPGDLVVEAGAGDGLLTEALAGAGFRVIAVEKDERLFGLLRQRVANRPNVACHHADFLTFALPSVPYRVVSNVPYAITAALVRKLLHAARPPDGAMLIVQREAAEKFAGTPRETLFSLLHKPWFEISVAGIVRRRDFVPAPRVHSVLLRIRRRDNRTGETFRVGLGGGCRHLREDAGAGAHCRARRRRRRPIRPRTDRRHEPRRWIRGPDRARQRAATVSRDRAPFVSVRPCGRGTHPGQRDVVLQLPNAPAARFCPGGHD